jgi:N-acylglucosamine-6-phosphate 2-epimerase
MINMHSILKKLKGGLIVSCQALEHEPLYGSDIMARMAIAAVEGGAVGIRANTPVDIKAIKKAVSVPVIGLYKVDYDNSEIYITPTVKEVEAVVDAGADIVAIDLTSRRRPDGMDNVQLIAETKAKFPEVLLMADVSTAEEAKSAAAAGVNLISTTMVGYTQYTTDVKNFDPDILKDIVSSVTIPVVAEGRIYSPEQAAKCLELGAFSVVVGSAITRPHEITRRFTNEMAREKEVGTQ